MLHIDAKSGQLVRAKVDGNQYVHGISGGRTYNRSIVFSIKPEKKISKVSDIAELGYFDIDSNMKVVYRVGLDADSTRIRFFNAYYNVTLIPDEQLPLDTNTNVRIVEIFESNGGLLFRAKFKIYFAGKRVLLHREGVKLGRKLPPDLYFASPPE